MVEVFRVRLRRFGRFMYEAVSGTGLPRVYRERPCQGRAWRAAFPSASKHDIREFLRAFIAAFIYRDRDKLKFSPNDSIYAVYRAQYRFMGWGDACELEMLSSLMKKQYNVSLASLWADSLTLGQLFEAAQAGKQG
jgi:hypothetical protein